MTARCTLVARLENAERNVRRLELELAEARRRAETARRALSNHDTNKGPNR